MNNRSKVERMRRSGYNVLIRPYLVLKVLVTTNGNERLEFKNISQAFYYIFGY